MTNIPLYERFWVLCLLAAATKAGLAPATRDNLFALAYLGSAVADALGGDTVQRSFLRRTGGPRVAIVGHELNRLAGLGLARVTRVVRAPDGNLEPHYYAADVAFAHLAGACRASEHLMHIRQFHDQVALSFAELGSRRISERATGDASFDEVSVGEGDVIDVGELRLSYPTLEAVQAVRDALPKFRDASAFSAVQVYGRFLSVQHDPLVTTQEPVWS